jgi:hypothetical protein
MTTQSKVFIASSSEGLDVAKAVRRLLLNELADKAKVEPWTRRFELSATYIESLEKIAVEADFAVLVLTPDDVTTSRKKEKLAPRDNVIFELGLFMGALGRERCYLVHEDRPDLKLPSDLLGVKSATFKSPNDGDLEAALDAGCALIAKRITNLGVRQKLSPDVGAEQTSVRTLCDRMKGTWWERVTLGGIHSLSLLQIDLDDLHNSVHLRGQSYDAEGSLMAYWRSYLARVDREEGKVLYLWQGWHPASPSARPEDRFHGFGEIEFEIPGETIEPITGGKGKFWDVNETHPEKTVAKVSQFRRVMDKGEISTMISGKDKQKRVLVMKRLLDW